MAGDHGTCLACGKPTRAFHSSGKHAKFCNPKCNSLFASWKHEHHCQDCGATWKSGNKIVRRCRPCANAAMRGVRKPHIVYPEINPHGCVVCQGPTKIFASSGKSAQVCSKKCQSRRAHNRRRARGKKAPRDIVATYTCIECGNDFLGTRRAKCCKMCSTRKAAAVHADNVRGKLIVERIGNFKIGAFSTVAFKECAWCGKLRGTRPKDVVGPFCGIRCYQLKAASDRNKNKAVRSCPECAAQFCPVYQGRIARPFDYCSDVCAESAAKRRKRDIGKHRKRARYYGGTIGRVSRREVFDRDGWRCRACGCDTPRNLIGTCNDNAPELDHVIALSRGGSHTMDNVQLLCRVCNILKGHRPMIDHLARIGMQTHAGG